MLTPLLLRAVRDDLDMWEEPVEWMYLDSEGLVTVGCGVQLATAGEAAKIPFYRKDTLKAATEAEIKAEWEELHKGAKAQKSAAGKKKFSAAHYKSSTLLRITEETSDALRDRHIEADYRNLKFIYRDFDAFPLKAKVALFDMIYNLGVGRRATSKHRASGLRRFAQLNAAIERRDWESAARLCRRHGIPEDRNRDTAALFRACVVRPEPALPSAVQQSALSLRRP
jgi:hypothetical protein